jgi:LmbE family N-acetylglucosaminyl deacetylase
MSDLAGRTLVAVLAHPDDESIACGGTLAMLVEAGVRVVLVSVSRGERGTLSGAIDAQLGCVRVRELLDAARCLGINDVVVFDYPDGDIRNASVTELEGRIRMVLARYRPDAVITFGADGLYWHPDHIAVHDRATAAVQSLSNSAPLLYYVTMPPAAMAGIIGRAKKGGWTPPAAGLWSLRPEAWGYAAAPPQLVINVKTCVSRKIAAIWSHRSQMTNDPLGTVTREDLELALSAEHFHRAPNIAVDRALLENLPQCSLDR